MGSCYSTTKVEQRKRIETEHENGNELEADSTKAEETGSKSPPEISPLRRERPRSHHHRRRQGSGRWRRKRSSSSSSFSAGGDEPGHLWGSDGIEIPGRLCANGASRIACLYTQQGKKGTNQDAMVVWERFGARDDTVFCGVFDGHGPFGHLVARKIRDSLPIALSTNWNSHENPELENEEEEIENEGFPEMHRGLRNSMLRAFRSIDKDLKLDPRIDSFCSGSTAVALVRRDEHLVIGNVGDSRAVLATRDESGNLTPRQLTVDLKPDLPREEARIRECKGRVFALRDEPEVARVWLPNSDSPGLAMARAFGDFCLKDYGLISVPEISCHSLDRERDEFVILATDGVWDVISNREAVEIVGSAPGGARNAARALVDSAVRAWRLKFPTSKNDDCAAVCLFLRPEKPAGEKPVAVEHCCSGEIVAEAAEKEKSSPAKRSLAECLSEEEEEGDWSALEGVTRVNSLLSLPRFLSGDKNSGSWRKKWL